MIEFSRSKIHANRIFIIMTSLKTFEFLGEIELMDSNVWGHFVRIPNEIASYFSLHTDDMRVVCTFNSSIVKQCAIMSSGQGYHFVMMTKDMRKKLSLQIGDQVSVTIVKDDSKYGLPMPEEFEEVLRQDKIADNYFHALTKGKQRTLLHIAGNVKNSKKRIERAFAIAHHLKTQNGFIDHKVLNEDIKAFRNYR